MTEFFSEHASTLSTWDEKHTRRWISYATFTSNEVSPRLCPFWSLDTSIAVQILKEKNQGNGENLHFWKIH